MKEIKQLSGYFSSCRDESKLGILTNGDKYLFFKSSIDSQNHMDLKEFVSIELSKISYDKVDILAQFTRDNMAVWSSSENRNLSDFREKVRAFLTSVKQGVLPSYVMEILCSQSNTTDIYKNDKEQLREIIKDEINITFDIDEYGFKHVKTLDKFEIDEEVSEEAEKLCDEQTDKKDAQIDKNKEYIFTDNTFISYRGCKLDYAILMGNKLENINSRKLLCNVIQYVIEQNEKNKDILLKEFSNSKGNYRIVSGKISQKEFYYLDKFDVSIFVKSAIDIIFKFIQKIFDIFDMPYASLVICFKD